ncbi:hypothetical protein [Pseudomonas viridiflava]|uniref:hypothetical protein n=1 Tax=Pseudomonas viridiflava TaxID=33069 RepID=UPI000F061D8C|nr:hypothetical protein [Pseudomonas viridiflava]MBD8189809.1 hypothetical protein [Pseudomonas viridiflava]MDY0938441.1 hypothetical protein [Pseudomonas viridiflava]MDY1015451.1 hypothetical protein [Pseudomonas viridiflava]TKJ54741.1 hypothetical protein PviCFBP13507_26540 [Pseudomonas viridiflava]TKK17098.1 hypothetical protein PviCFBP13515_26260 [Pseudomonas viridiflava]
MIKQFLFIFLLGIPFACLYYALENYLPNSWIPAVTVMVLMVIARAGLYLYRRSKGIKDPWLNE